MINYRGDNARRILRTAAESRSYFENFQEYHHKKIPQY